MESLIYNNENIKKHISNNYSYYLDEIVKKKTYLNDVLIERLRFPDIDGYDKSYFHFITKEFKNFNCACPNLFIKCIKNFEYNPLINDSAEPRMICPHRIYCIKFLKNFFSADLWIWEKTTSTPKGRRNRIMLYDYENSYVMALERRNNGKIFIRTAYPVNDQITKNKFKKEYLRYNKKKTVTYLLSHKK